MNNGLGIEPSVPVERRLMWRGLDMIGSSDASDDWCTPECDPVAIALCNANTLGFSALGVRTATLPVRVPYD